MEKETWMHYCEQPKDKKLTLCDIKDEKMVQIWNLNVPYDSTYYFDTVQIKNCIYFTGGGNQEAEGAPKQFYQITMKLTVMPGMTTVADKLANMNVPRADHTMGSLLGIKLYVIGGLNSTGYISSCEEYDIAGNKWREIASLNEKKSGASICSYKERYLYTFGGGISGDHKASNLIECLDTKDPSTKTWTIVKIAIGDTLFKKCITPGAAVISDDCILIFGGLVGEKPVDTCLKFDPIKLAIEKGPSLLRKDTFYRTKYGIINDKVKIVGSADGDLHTYNKTNNKWELMLKKIWNPNYGLNFKADTL